MPENKYSGSLSLDWHNKDKSVLGLGNIDPKSASDVPAPFLNWVNKDEALFYEIDDSEGRGIKPYWVDRNDIRVKEPRPLVLQRAYKAEKKKKDLTDSEWVLKISEENDPIVENMLIKGDNLLALNSLVKMFENKPDEEKVKCIYIDPPFNTGSAFENYDDNLEHSEWLTMMRDRIVLLYNILRDDGCIFMHLDDKEASYGKVLLDEVFGRNNYCNNIIFATNSAFGFKGTADYIFKQANHILFYAKNKEIFEINKDMLLIEKEYDTAYRYIFKNISISEDKWEWESINENYSKTIGFSSYKEAINKLGQEDFNAKIGIFAIENADRVFQTAAVSGGAFLKRKITIEKSLKIKNKIIRHPNDDMDYMFIGGRRVLFYKERLRYIDGHYLPVEIITDIWTDIPVEGMANEGGVDFPKSKKPEKLIQRLIDISTNSKDIVLDCFGGSGTTMAVAHKMGRRWIGIEIGKHADTHIIPRLKSVITGEDQSAISKSVNWQGGGSFKYYHLGPSILTLDEKDRKDFNWDLPLETLAGGVLYYYDYKSTESSTVGYYLGIRDIKGQKGVALVKLEKSSKGKAHLISEMEIIPIIEKVRKQYKPYKIQLFTNCGIGLTADDMPDDFELVKVPQKIISSIGESEI